MPREQINYAHVPTSEEPQHMDPEVSVAWGGENERYVQVSFQADISWVQGIANADNGADSRLSLYSPVLTRSEINKMIRALRRARDKSYGADA